MEEKIQKIFQNAGLSLKKDETKNSAIQKTLVFLEELDKWSSKISLISKGDQGHILEKHFAESLQYSKGFKDTTRLVDIGSGAGFPGIPLKIGFPDLNIVLIESQRKRAGFLESVIRKMNLKNCEVAFGRAEEISAKKQYEQSFNTATFRSVASLEKCLILGEPFLKKKGRILIKKELDIQFQRLDPMILSEELSFETNDERKSKLMVFEKSST